MEEALQWWYEKKLAQLKSEADVIREQLLQESFAMRRSMEISSVESYKLDISYHRKCIKQLEKFDLSLKELGDRLYPSSLNEGLPFAIEQLCQRYQQSFGCQFQLNLPQKWVLAPPYYSFIVLDILEDLLRTQLKKTLSNNLIFIDLEQNISDGKTNNRLKVALEAKNALNQERQVEYLQQVFASLTSGTCQNIVTEDSNIWLFSW